MQRLDESAIYSDHVMLSYLDIRIALGTRVRGVGQASRAHIFAESAAQNPYIFRIAGLRVYRPAGTAGVNLNKVRR